MTPDEAHSALLSVPQVEGPHSDSPLFMSHLVPAYRAADDATKDRVHRALTVLFESPNPRHRALAREFASGAGLPESVLSTLGQQYLDTKNADLGHVFAQSYYQRAPADLEATFHQRFVEDPLAWPDLALSALRHSDDGATWSAFTQLVASIDDPDALAELCNLGLVIDRLDDVLKLLADTKSEEVVEAIAARLPKPTGATLRSLAG